MTTVAALCHCDQNRMVSTVLAGLIRDLHTSIASGREAAELLPLAALLHTQVTVPWLRLVGAPLALMLARKAAQEHETPAPMGLVTVSRQSPGRQ